MRNLLALIAAIAVAPALSLYLSAGVEHSPLWARIDPLATIKLLGFGLAWGAGVPEALAPVLASLLYLLPPTLAFFAVRRLLRPRVASGAAR